MRVSAILAGLLSVVGFASTKEFMVEVKQKEEQNYTRLTMVPKDTLKVSLKENILTGYNWNIKTVHSNAENHINLITDLYTPADSELMGASGMRTFVFSAETQGDQVIQLIYARQWELQEMLEKMNGSLVSVETAKKMGYDIDLHTVKVTVTNASQE